VPVDHRKETMDFPDSGLKRRWDGFSGATLFEYPAIHAGRFRVDSIFRMATHAASVFLCHNGADKSEVECIANKVLANGIHPWLDKWNLVPGEPFQEAIENALATCHSCAVFVEKSSSAPWQNQEMRTAIARRVGQTDGSFPVIPVLLPGACHPPVAFPAFLSGTTWVVFKSSLDEVGLLRFC
jgi:hypothetical protein